MLPARCANRNPNTEAGENPLHFQRANAGLSIVEAREFLWVLTRHHVAIL